MGIGVLMTKFQPKVHYPELIVLLVLALPTFLVLISVKFHESEGLNRQGGVSLILFLIAEQKFWLLHPHHRLARVLVQRVVIFVKSKAVRMVNSDPP